ncbi:hypothetical protein [Janibacter sp. YB324]|uniref:hypothetical protein n=1 Tax=Janibacter sp. YB324 TaxID=2761047 RepID=UPI00162691F5|nr:hypothetical protein [Janibacter sp. YB324]QNF93570.1 hypothetical protein H7A72_12490 [Janibacter sp. YB324]
MDQTELTAIYEEYLAKAVEAAPALQGEAAKPNANHVYAQTFAAIAAAAAARLNVVA